MSEEKFVVKQYSSDSRPTIKGNGFDGLEVGETREEAEEFALWINHRLAERDAALARCVEFIGALAKSDSEVFKESISGAMRQASKNLLASLPTSAQATAKVLAAARNLSLLLEQRNKMEDADDFGEPLGEVYQGVVDAEIALREAIREEQEGK